MRLREPRCCKEADDRERLLLLLFTEDVGDKLELVGPLIVKADVKLDKELNDVARRW
jgi:hypothetical protein